MDPSAARTTPCPCGSGRLVGPADFVYADPCYAYEAEERAARVAAWLERERTRGVVKEYHRKWNLEITPWTGGDNDPDPARRMVFYTGVGHPNHLAGSPVPLFLSIPTLTRYRTVYAGQGQDWPVQNFGVPWAGDSGAFAALMLNKDRAGHPWSWCPDEYGSTWVGLIEAISHEAPRELGPDFVAVQDWPCEPKVRAHTGYTVREHQEMTLESYRYLAREFYFVPWLPTLQGWHPWEYVEHFEMYRRAGIDLRGERVGIGSVCRRGAARDVARVLGTLAPCGMRMHGFGVSIDALRLAGHLLASSDSQAWSWTARAEGIRLPGCTHRGKPNPKTGVHDCRNCFRYALAYREEVMDALRECDRTRSGVVSEEVEQLALDLFDPSGLLV